MEADTQHESFERLRAEHARLAQQFDAAMGEASTRGVSHEELLGDLVVLAVCAQLTRPLTREERAERKVILSHAGQWRDQLAAKVDVAKRGAAPVERVQGQRIPVGRRPSHFFRASGGLPGLGKRR